MTFAPVIETQTDVERAWRALMRPLGWTRASTWLMFVGPDGRPFAHLTEIDDCEGPPPADVAAQLGRLLGHLRDGPLPAGVRVAFLRSRPGVHGIEDDDRAWAATLYAAARTAGMPAEVVHLATDEDVVAVPMEEATLPATT
ncbi:hypothetical protein GGQ22_02950 [Nocardioides sp. zg-579]|uniref:Uncharacterized protein n=1 Tax=Nocardioides marmotae TaxID=2663857 RepID=A0A6I3IZ99_9ACTN|nr:hypothetical protein [Nocardioides marmotae]MCR6030396.1 hypothetical protein [Gordonia jinghuaiqii]MTB94031.1 hypothetical protein [Nocardioides marmotae]QKE00340.1 hypothetical protein HPC71_04030 [Nocardioides marmotae]